MSAREIGRVVSVKGTVRARVGDGNERILGRNDAVLLDDELGGETGSAILLQLHNGGVITLGGRDSIQLGHDLLMAASEAELSESGFGLEPFMLWEEDDEDFDLDDDFHRSHHVEQLADRGDLTPGYPTGTFQMVYESDERYVGQERARLFTDDTGPDGPGPVDPPAPVEHSIAAAVGDVYEADLLVDGAHTIGSLTVSEPGEVKAISIFGETFDISSDLSELVGEEIHTPYGIITITDYDGSGTFSFEYALNQAIDHTTEPGYDTIPIEVNYGDGSSLSTEVTVNIHDDTPHAKDTVDDVLEGFPFGDVTNVLLILDISSSMRDENSNNSGRLTALKDAVSNLMEAYEDNGGFVLKIVTFASDGTIIPGVFTDVQSVLDWIDALTYESGTNYQAAVNAAMSGWDEANIYNADHSNSVAYFITDGSPTSGTQLTDEMKADWEAYVDEHFSACIGIGIGSSDLDSSDMKTVVHTPGGSGDEDDQIYLVNDLSELTGTLTQTIEFNEEERDIIEFTGSDYGADGAGAQALFSVEYKGSTHIFSGADDEVVFELDSGGKITFYGDGTYKLVAADRVGDVLYDEVRYTIVDSDGSSSTATLTIQTSPKDAVLAANDDIAYVSMGGNDVVSGGVFYNKPVTTSMSGFWSANCSNTNQVYEAEGFTRQFSLKADADHVASVTAEVFIEGYLVGDVITVYLLDAEGNAIASKNIIRTSQSFTAMVSFDGIDVSGSYQLRLETLDNTPASTSLRAQIREVVISQYYFSIDVAAPAVTGGNVLENDYGHDARLIRVNDLVMEEGGTLAITGLYGTLYIDYDGSYYYVPFDGITTHNASDIFTYTISNGSSESTASIIVQLENGMHSGTYDVPTNGNDLLLGDENDNVIHGGDGNDHIIGGGGNDTLYGGDGDDYLSGGTGDDILYGGNGSDYLDGGSGNDILVGGPGDDLLKGGLGNDTFYYEAGDLADVVHGDIILDFHVGLYDPGNAGHDDNADILNIAELLSGSGRAADGSDLIAGGYLIFEAITRNEDGSVTVQISIDADGALGPQSTVALATIIMDGLVLSDNAANHAQEVLEQLIANNNIVF